MNYVSKSIFNFKGFEVSKVLKNDKEITIYLVPRRKTSLCPKCHKRSKQIYEIGKLRKIRHSRFEGKLTTVLLPKRRFFCPNCQLPFNEKIDWVAPKARTTTNFAEETIHGLKNSSFSAISEMYTTSYQFLSRNLKNFDLNVVWPKGELILGFDEHSYAKRHMMVTVTDLKTRTLLAVLPHYNRQSVENYLNSRPKEELERVIELCFDMKFKQRSTVESFFPEAPTVFDKFHVLSYLASLIDADRKFDAPGIKSYENIRQIMRKPKRALSQKEFNFLKSTFKRHPELKEKWDIYQKLSIFYLLKSKIEAKKILNEIKNDLSKLNHSYTKKFLGTLNRSEKEILNYFNNFTTNAFTEGVHTKIKMIKRTSFGFRNIDIYIRKVMLAFIPIVLIISQLLPH